MDARFIVALYLLTYLTSILLGWGIINPIIRTLSWHYLDRSVSYGSWIPRLLGLVEQIIFTTSYLAGKAELIGIWLLMKTAGEWGTQAKEAQSQTRANDYAIFLIGTALSLMLSIGTAIFIQQVLPVFPLVSK